MESSPPSPLIAITGALGDIGSAIAEAFSANGYGVERSDLKPREEIDSAQRDRYQMVDVASETSVENWFESLVARNDKAPDVCVVNAGIVRLGSATELSGEDWQTTMDVNLTGAWRTACGAARCMKAFGSKGNIVFIGSWVGQYPIAHLAGYSVSKAALHALVKVMALELAADGIRVNEVAPGYVDAGLSARLFERDDGLRQRAVDSVPLQCLVSAEEVAAAVVFLSNPANANITGSTLTLDGGLSLMHGPQNTTPAR